LKILILKPSSLGDVVQALPVLRLLKRAQPDHQIYWWLSTELLPLLENDPDLTGLFAFQRRGWSRGKPLLELLRSIGQMRALRFDLVLDLQGLARSSLVAWLARGRLTIGLEDWREGAPALYDLTIPRPSALTHAVDWYLMVLKHLGVPIHWDFQWIPPFPDALRTLRQKWQPGPHRWVACNPGARWTNKRWPVESYAAAVARLARAHPDVRFVILGSSADASLGRTVCHAAPERCLDLTGRTSLPEMVEWIRLSELLITNDTGPMHVAAALRKPIVALFGPTEARRTGPYGQLDRVLRHRVPCAPCLSDSCANSMPLECLRGIPPEAVCARAHALLDNRPDLSAG
jgi:lipopolysaccharide heptosyltransferase II